MPDEQPYRNFNFRVEIDGLAVADFSEVEVPDVSIEVVEYREGTDRVSGSRKLPGRARFGNVVLRRGVTDNLELYGWFRAVLNGDLQRRNVAIVLQNAEREDVRRWLVRGAWIAKYEGPTLNAEGNDVAIETVELACEGLELE
ncbi:MAG: phage tail protein [Gaiellaceae bacterium]